MINIKDKYFIEAEQIDYSAWVMVDGINPKTKKPTITKKLIGYYSSVSSCLRAIRNYEIHNSILNDNIDLYGVIRTIDEADKKFIEYVKEHFEDKANG